MSTEQTGGIVQSEMDAWEQLYELQERYTRIYETLADGYERRDLIVRADALERCVWVHGEGHNVKTIRQYIDVLEQACVFVEDANPTWAKRPHTGR